MQQLSQFRWALNAALLALCCAGLLVAGAALGGVAGFFIALAVLAVAVALAACYFASYMITRPKTHPLHDDGTARQKARRSMAELERHRREQEYIAQLQPYGLEEWYLESGDGLRLHAVYLPPAPGDGRVALLLHGHRQSASQMAEYAVYFRSLGLGALMPDARAHGKSAGRFIGMGWPDRLDAIAWMNELVRRLGPGVRLMVYGISMGAATAMMAAGEALPPQVRFIAEDCGYTSVYDEAVYQVKHSFQLPPFPVVPLGSLVIRARAGYDIKEASAVRQLARGTLPMLFIHGDADDYVPYAMLQPLYDAAATADKQLVTMPGAGHVQAFPSDDGRVRAALAQTIDRLMPAAAEHPAKNADTDSAGARNVHSADASGLNNQG